jgi:hypothetical protein
MISKKKALFAMVGIALMAIIGIPVLTNMWTSASISMHCAPADIVTLALFEDCDLTKPATVHDWDGVTQGNTYEYSIFVKNTGSRALYITYLPTDIWDADKQSHLVITCKVILSGTQCQLLTPQNYVLPEKDPALPANGFLLNPTKVIKIDIELFVESVVSGMSYDWTFIIYGATG